MKRKLIAAEDLPYELGKTVRSEIEKYPAVVSFVQAAEKTKEIQLLREVVDGVINKCRRNQGKEHLSTDVFSLLDMDMDRHAATKTVAKFLNRLQKAAAKALEVPVRESSLPWIIAASEPLNVA